jgi:hypothetical protein
LENKIQEIGNHVNNDWPKPAHSHVALAWPSNQNDWVGPSRLARPVSAPGRSPHALRERLPAVWRPRCCAAGGSLQRCQGCALQGGGGGGSLECRVIMEAAVQVGHGGVLRLRCTLVDGDGQWQVLELLEDKREMRHRLSEEEVLRRM